MSGKYYLLRMGERKEGEEGTGGREVERGRTGGAGEGKELEYGKSFLNFV